MQRRDSPRWLHEHDDDDDDDDDHMQIIQCDTQKRL